MILKRAHLTFLIVFTWAACSNEEAQKTSSATGVAADSLPAKSNIDQQIQNTLTLTDGFEIKVGRKESFEKFEGYSLFILLHNGKQIYIDTSLTEYEFGDKLYPIIRPVDKETFEVFVEVNNRPHKNYLKYFRVHQDKIIRTEEFPTFIAAASNLDTDAHLEFAGFLDWGEVWGKSVALTAYNPIIYYELKPNEISLDSTLTINKNKEIYEGFHGFSYNQKVEVHYKNQKRDNEIDRISGLAAP